MGTMKLLRNRVLNFDGFDLFVERRQRVAPSESGLADEVCDRYLIADYVPLFRGDHFDNA